VRIGTLEAVRLYPVKSLRGKALDRVEVTRTGIPGDRADALFVGAGSERVGKIYRGKEHERLHLLADAETAHLEAMQRGVEVELRRGEHFFDAAPVSILIDRWLDEISTELGYRVEWERFRPNFFVRAAYQFGLGEPELVGAELQLGTVALRVRSPIERCVVTTYDPQAQGSDARILRFLAQRRNAWMGIYCDVLEPGIVRVGDELTKEAPLRDASPPPHPGGLTA
jgi:uncharacterized protein